MKQINPVLSKGIMLLDKVNTATFFLMQLSFLADHFKSISISFTFKQCNYLMVKFCQENVFLGFMT